MTFDWLQHRSGLLQAGITILLCLVFQSGYGLESDQSQPINIRADSGVIDDGAGKSTYQGNVSIDQGSLLITAELVEIYMENRDPVRIVATGNPQTLAHYQQVPEPSEEPVVAKAREIIYFIQEERLVLTGSAKISQLADFFAGDEIRYDIANGVINANTTSGLGQVRMTISPRGDPDSDP